MLAEVAEVGVPTTAPSCPAIDEATPSGCRSMNHYPPPTVPALDGVDLEQA